MSKLTAEAATAAINSIILDYRAGYSINDLRHYINTLAASQPPAEESAYKLLFDNHYHPSEGDPLETVVSYSIAQQAVKIAAASKPPAEVADNQQPSLSRDQVREWQPIETAPKDGTDVDLLIDDDDGDPFRFCDCKYDAAAQGWFALYDGKRHKIVAGTITHWMPIHLHP